MSIIKRTNCQVCNKKLMPASLKLGNHPLCDDLIKIGSSEICKEYPIEISLCNNCYTAHNLYNINKEILFPKNYHFRPRFTMDVLNGMRDLVDSVEKDLKSLQDLLVCDVGCNDGSLLNFFKEKKAHTSGIEPTDSAHEAKEQSHYIIQDYFTEKACEKYLSRKKKPDIITFTNVFAHTEDLSETLNCLKKIMKIDTYLVIENHYLGTIVKTNQFDTFYHEHPRTYSVKSFQEIAKKLELEIVNIKFPERYGGNIRVSMINSKSSKIKYIKSKNQVKFEDENYIPKYFSNVQNFINNWKNVTSEKIEDLLKYKLNIYGKSFPGRAAILTKLLNLNENHMKAVFEKEGSAKINHYVPSTRIKILGDNNWVTGEVNPDIFIIWGWHIHKEIKNYLRKNNFKGRIFTPLPEFIELK